jgi:hypothetical protein
VDLLRRILTMAEANDTRVDDEPGNAARIANMCDGLPLALRIIGALLAEDPGRSLAAMASDLSDKRNRLGEMSYPGGAVRASFDLSYQHLEAEGARLFRLLPLNPGPDISAAAAAALAGINPTAAPRLLAELAQLIEQRTGHDLWRIYGLVRLYADEQGQPHAEADAREEARGRLMGYYASATRAANAIGTSDDPDPGALGFADRQQALGWLAAEYPAGGQDDDGMTSALQDAIQRDRALPLAHDEGDNKTGTAPLEPLG